MEDLRKWTSAEAIGEITVAPHCVGKVAPANIHNATASIDNSYASFSTSYMNGIDVTADVPDISNDQPLDHKLPSPEEQCQSIANKYPAELIRVDTSDVRFQRQCSIRKSLGHVPMSGASRKQLEEESLTVKRRTRSKKSVGKRRNTIAGTDNKEIKEACSQR